MSAIVMVKWLAKFAIGSIILLAGLYFVISLCVALFKLTGRLIEGQPMYFDLQTPTWTGLIISQVTCVAILSIGFFLRGKLRGRPEQLQ